MNMMLELSGLLSACRWNSPSLLITVWRIVLLGYTDSGRGPIFNLMRIFHALGIDGRMVE